MTARKSKTKASADQNMLTRLSSGADELVGAVAEFLLRSELPSEAVADVLESVAARVRSGRFVSEWQGGVADFTDRLGRAYQSWWNDPTYLDRNGSPIPLPLSGPKKSVRALLKRRILANEMSAALKVLADSPSVSVGQDGYWRAHEATLVVKPDRELSFQRLVGLVRGLLNTFHANNSHRRSGSGLMERTVVSGNLPANFVPVLNRAVHEHFGQALFSILQMIKNAERRSGRRSGTEVGVEVFMYELPRVRKGAGKKRAGSTKTKGRPR
jgi:hypothetical protein